MHQVREHLDHQARAHRKTRDEALREAAVAKAEADASQPPAAPPGGMQGGEEGFWEVGDE
jgi:hypothetical protein